MMIFNRRSSESDLDRLEREANDDFRLLDELGPGMFGLEHLMELREQSRARLNLFQRRQKLAMILGSSAAGWIFLAIIARFAGKLWIAFAAYALGSLCIFAFLGILFWQKRKFESKGELEYTLMMIEEELRRRAGKMSWKPRRN